jgi:hypothetical protein
VQDLVNRLLHESLGGGRVDATKPDWEEDNLRRVNVMKGLERKRTAGEISASDFDAITEVLKISRAAFRPALLIILRTRLG